MASNPTVVVPMALPPIPPNIAQTAAPVLIGIMVSWAFWGMLLVQVYNYSFLFRDRLWVKCFVYVVFIIDTLQTFMMAVDAYYWFASGFGNLTHLADAYLSVFDVPILGSLLALLGQSFLCHRIFMLGKQKWLSLSLFAICFMSLVGAWYNAIRGHILAGSIMNPQAVIDIRALYVWLVSAAIGDTGIAAAMTYLLLHARGGFKPTDVILNRLVVLTMETSSVSAFLAVLTLILYFTTQGTGYFLTPGYVLGKCYANALLVTLNNRHFVKDRTRLSGNAALGLMHASRRSKGRFASELSVLSNTLGDTVDEYYQKGGVEITTFKTTSTGEPFQLGGVKIADH